MNTARTVQRLQPLDMLVDTQRAKQRDEAKAEVKLEVPLHKTRKEVGIIGAHCDDLIEQHKEVLQQHHRIQQLLQHSREESSQWRNELNMIMKEQQVHEEMEEVQQEGNTVA